VADGGFWRGLRRVLLVFLVFALGGGTFYMVSERNHRRLRVEREGSRAVVVQGRFWPRGFEPFRAEADNLQPAYAPLEVPSGLTVEPRDVDSPAALQDLWFGLIMGYARHSLAANDVGAAKGYVARAEALPAVAAAQRTEIAVLRAQLHFIAGQRRVAELSSVLDAAEVDFRKALELGLPQREDADRSIADIHTLLALAKLEPEGRAQALALWQAAQADADTGAPTEDPAAAPAPDETAAPGDAVPVPDENAAPPAQEPAPLEQDGAPIEQPAVADPAPMDHPPAEGAPAGPGGEITL
jgi:hypothetical protein